MLTVRSEIGPYRYRITALSRVGKNTCVRELAARNRYHSLSHNQILLFPRGSLILALRDNIASRANNAP